MWTLWLFVTLCDGKLKMTIWFDDEHGDLPTKNDDFP
jgi:hypothetical protein